jgi:flagellar basal-body rod protein FlgB
MSSLIESPRLAALTRFLDLTTYRAGIVASNLANIDTPGYRTRDINFRGELERAQGEMQYAGLAPLLRTPQGLIARPDGNNVSLERESLLLAETQMKFNLGVQLLRAELHAISSAIHEGSSS